MSSYSKDKKEGSSFYSQSPHQICYLQSRENRRLTTSIDCEAVMLQLLPLSITHSNYQRKGHYNDSYNHRGAWRAENIFKNLKKSEGFVMEERWLWGWGRHTRSWRCCYSTSLWQRPGWCLPAASGSSSSLEDGISHDNSTNFTMKPEVFIELFLWSGGGS